MQTAAMPNGCARSDDFGPIGTLNLKLEAARKVIIAKRLQVYVSFDRQI